MQIEYMDVKELIPYVNNPRRNDAAVEKVAESIRVFGFRVPITLDKNRVIVTGHTRLKAAIRLGMEKVPVIILDDMTEDQVKAFRLVDNKTSEYAEWDFDALAIELHEIQMDLGAFDFELPGAAESVEEDDFKVELPKKPITKLGDIYQLGRHRLMCGDATSSDDLEVLMDFEAADLYLTDPPYNVDYEGTAGKIINDKQESEQFQEFLTDAFTNANMVLKPGAAFYIWHADSKGYNFRAAAQRTGWKIRQAIIWNKNALVLGRQDYQWKHEPCLYGWKDGAPHYFINDRSFTTVIEDAIDINKLKLNEARDLLKKLLDPKVPSTIINEDKPHHNDAHPTMKPLRLLSRLIANSTKQGALVLDTFGGSGSTMMACEQLNRRCFMMELDPRFVDVIIERYEKLTNDKAHRVKEGGSPV